MLKLADIAKKERYAKAMRNVPFNLHV